MDCDMEILTDRMVDELRQFTRKHDFWGRYLEPLTTTGSTPFAVHLAILLEPYLKFIFEGSKTVESRFSRHRIAPYGAVHSGDVVLLKGSAAKAVSGICIVRKVWFHQLNSDKLELIRNCFATALRADDSSFWEKHRSARFATLMRIAEVYRLPPIQVPKRDRRGWVVLRSRQQQFLYDRGSQLT